MLVLFGNKETSKFGLDVLKDARRMGSRVRGRDLTTSKVCIGLSPRTFTLKNSLSQPPSIMLLTQALLASELPSNDSAIRSLNPEILSSHGYEIDGFATACGNTVQYSNKFCNKVFLY